MRHRHSNPLTLSRVCDLRLPSADCSVTNCEGRLGRDSTALLGIGALGGALAGIGGILAAIHYGLRVSGWRPFTLDPLTSLAPMGGMG